MHSTLNLTLQAVDDDVEVKLAHAGDDRLPGFFVGPRLERGVFLLKTRQTFTEFLAVGLGLRLDGHRDNRLRKDHALKQNRVLRIAKRVARVDVAQSNGSHDVAREDFFDLFRELACMRSTRPTRSFLARRGVEQRGAALELTLYTRRKVS